RKLVGPSGESPLPVVLSYLTQVVTALEAVRRIAFPIWPPPSEISRTFWRNVPTCCLIEFNSGRDGSPSRPSNCLSNLATSIRNKTDVVEKSPYLLSDRVYLR